MLRVTVSTVRECCLQLVGTLCSAADVLVSDSLPLSMWINPLSGTLSLSAYCITSQNCAAASRTAVCKIWVFLCFMPSSGWYYLCHWLCIFIINKYKYLYVVCEDCVSSLVCGTLVLWLMEHTASHSTMERSLILTLMMNVLLDVFNSPSPPTHVLVLCFYNNITCFSPVFFRCFETVFCVFFVLFGSRYCQ